MAWDIFQIGLSDTHSDLEPNLEKLEGKGRREEYLRLLPFRLLIFMDQRSPHGAFKSLCTFGLCYLSSRKSDPKHRTVHCFKEKVKQRLWPLWLGLAVAVSCCCCGSLRAHNEGFAETHVHGRHVERPSTVEPVLTRWLDLLGTNGWNPLGVSESGEVYKLNERHQNSQ